MYGNFLLLYNKIFYSVDLKLDIESIIVLYCIYDFIHTFFINLLGIEHFKRIT